MCVCVCACVSLFLHFKCAASTSPFESFYELLLFLIANFISRIQRGTMIFAGTLVVSACMDVAK